MVCRYGVDAPNEAKYCSNCGRRLLKVVPIGKGAEQAAIIQLPAVLTAKEVADLLHVSTNMIYELCLQRKLPHIKIGRKYAFKTAEILSWAGTKERITTAG